MGDLHCDAVYKDYPLSREISPVGADTKPGPRNECTGASNNTVGRAVALHLVNLGSIPGQPGFYSRHSI